MTDGCSYFCFTIKKDMRGFSSVSNKTAEMNPWSLVKLTKSV